MTINCFHVKHFHQIIAPGHTNPDEAKKCVHNVIKAHARVYHLYDRVFRPNQGGKMGIGLLAIWHEAKNPGNSGQDRLADYVTDMTVNVLQIRERS